MPTQHRITVQDEEIAAVHHPAEDTDEWMVFCHGFLSDKTGSYRERCERAAREGYDAVRFDFRGCGDSCGRFRNQTLSSKIQDLDAVLNHFDASDAVLFGSSFGGKVAFHTAIRDNRVAAVVTRSPVTLNASFDDYRGVVEQEGTIEFSTDYGTVVVDRLFFTDFDRHPWDDVVNGLDCPAAFFHGADDAVVPPNNSFTAAETLQTDVYLQKFVGEDHRFSRDAEARFQDLAFTWLDAYI